MKRRGLIAAALALPAIARARGQGAAAGKAAARVVVVGGGFGGAAAARALRSANPALDVTLVEAASEYFACPNSSEVIAGLRSLDRQSFTWDWLAAQGIRVIQARAAGIDGTARRVSLRDPGGAALPDLAYDRLVLAPGVDMVWNAIEGYDEAAAEVMPHAWKAGAQTLNLRDRLRAMDDGGVVVMAIPATPYRCPPAPYERACLIAHYLKTAKPKSKLLLLDAKDQFSQQKLFDEAWAALYPGLVERVSLSDGGRVVSVDPKTMTIGTDFEPHEAAVANIIPPQRAAAIAQAAGVADRTGWCPIDPVTFESTRVPGIHVIGDAALTGAMPKAAFAANAQARACALAVASLLGGGMPEPPTLKNACYTLAAPGYGFSVAALYRPQDGVLTEIDGSGRTSPVGAPEAVRAEEARNGAAWFADITGQTFG